MHFSRASVVTLKEASAAPAASTSSDMATTARFTDERHCHALMQRLNEFRQRSELCDLTLEVEDGRFQCHKSVLIGASDYFQGMFSSRMKESVSPLISLPFLKADVLELILQFMYVGCASLNLPDEHDAVAKELSGGHVLDTVQRLLGAADMFQLDTLKAKCELFIVPKVEPSTCLQLYSFADIYNLNILKGKCREVKIEKFEGVVNSQDFLHLDVTSLVEYISDSCIEVPDEDAIYSAVRRWHEHDPAARAPLMERVLAHVRFPFCTPQYFLDVIETDPLMQRPVLQGFIREYKEFHLVAKRREEMRADGCERVQPRLAQMPQSLVVLGGRESMITGNLQGWFLEEKSKTWKHLCHLPFKGSMYGICTLWNKLYVTGGNDATNHTLTTVWEFSGTSLAWSAKAELLVAREQHGATACANRVYILGGIGRSKRILKSVESFDPLRNQWIPAPDLLDAVFGPAVAASSDRIFVIGGATFKLSELRYASNFSVQMFDTLSNQWSRLSNSIFRVTTGCATVVDGRVFVHCGYEKLSAVYKPDTDSWMYCGASPSGHARGRALTTKEGHIMLFGGKYRTEAGEHHQSDRVDLYDPARNQWTVLDYSLPKALTDFGVAWLRINPKVTQTTETGPTAVKMRRLDYSREDGEGVTAKATALREEVVTGQGAGPRGAATGAGDSFSVPGAMRCAGASLSSDVSGGSLSGASISDGSVAGSSLSGASVDSAASTSMGLTAMHLSAGSSGSEAAQNATSSRAGSRDSANASVDRAIKSRDSTSPSRDSANSSHVQAGVSRDSKSQTHDPLSVIHESRNTECDSLSAARDALSAACDSSSPTRDSLSTTHDTMSRNSTNSSLESSSATLDSSSSTADSVKIT